MVLCHGLNPAGNQARCSCSPVPLSLLQARQGKEKNITKVIYIYKLKVGTKDREGSLTGYGHGQKADSR